MLRWRNWELRHAGVQDRAPKVCPEQETQAEQGSSLNARKKTRRKRQPKPSIRRVNENKSPPPPPNSDEEPKHRERKREREREREGEKKSRLESQAFQTNPKEVTAAIY